MKITIGLLFVAMAFPDIVPAQLSQTNAPAVIPAPASLTNTDKIIPLIQFQDVPITTAIENLARQAHINYLLSPKLFQTDEPIINLRLTNITARTTLTRMLNLHNVRLVEDSVTGIAHIIPSGETINAVDATLLDMNTNSSPFYTNAVIPLIQFADVPLDTALENLIRQGGVKAQLDPQIKQQYLTFSARWEDVTPKQAIVALCENYSLMIVKDESTGALQIRPQTKH
jgi:hypothetical protein